MSREEFNLLEEVLVRLDVEEDRSATPVLSQHQRLLGLANLLDEARGIRAKGRQRLDVAAGFDLIHEDLVRYNEQYV